MSKLCFGQTAANALLSNSESDGFTTEHGDAVDQAVDPGGGGVILVKVQLELHKEHGNTSGDRDGEEDGLVHSDITICRRVTLMSVLLQIDFYWIFIHLLLKGCGCLEAQLQ